MSATLELKEVIEDHRNKIINKNGHRISKKHPSLYFTCIEHLTKLHYLIGFFSESNEEPWDALSRYAKTKAQCKKIPLLDKKTFDSHLITI